MKIAIFTHAFPPSSHANGKRPFYIARDFLNAGYTVVIYTSLLGCEGEVSEILKHPSCRVVRVGDPVMRGLLLMRKIKVLYRFAVTAVNGLIWPDFYRFWMKNAMKAYQQDGPFDKVLSFIFPASVYLAANKDLVDERWIFDLQESVTPQQSIVPRRSYFYKKRLPQLESLEKRALSLAGRVVFTAQSNREAYVKAGLVKQENTEHIPYFYDDAFFKTSDVELDKGFEFRYFGGFDWRGSRTPNLFLESLEEFLRRNPKARNETCFAFYGNWMSEHDTLIESFGLDDVVKINAPVSYSKYLEKVASAPLLLLVVAEEHGLFMPSKIVDYFGAERPILALVPDGSEMQYVLHKSGMEDSVVTSGERADVVCVLERLWERYLTKKLTIEGNRVKHWSSSYQLERYQKLIENLGE